MFILALLCLINGLVGAMLFSFGFQIKNNRKVYLINGYKENYLKDKELYLDGIGISEIISGLIFIVSGIIGLVTWSIGLIVIFDIVAIVFLIVCLSTVESKYGSM